MVEGNKDTITITSRTPYETVKGYSPDGYVVRGTSAPVYHAGDIVDVKDVAADAAGTTIIFVPHWVPVDEVNERNITINLYIEDPTDINGSDIPAANYLAHGGGGRRPVQTERGTWPGAYPRVY